MTNMLMITSLSTFQASRFVRDHPRQPRSRRDLESKPGSPWSTSWFAVYRPCRWPANMLQYAMCPICLWYTIANMLQYAMCPIYDNQYVRTCDVSNMFMVYDDQHVTMYDVSSITNMLWHTACHNNRYVITNDAAKTRCRRVCRHVYRHVDRHVETCV